MPELPEVETIRRGLQSLVIGQCIHSVEVLLPKMFIGSVEDIVGTSLVAAGRRGKLLIIRTSGAFSILIHLKMTGQLIFVRKDESTSLPVKSTKVIFTFESGDRLFFNDFRTFGYVQLFEQTRLHEHPFIQKVGFEPLESLFTQAAFYELLSKSKRSVIKAFLLDQTKGLQGWVIFTLMRCFLQRVYYLLAEWNPFQIRKENCFSIRLGKFYSRVWIYVVLLIPVM